MGPGELVLIIAVFLLGLIAIRLSGGDLKRLNDLHLRWSSVAVAALVTQVVIISLLPRGWRTGHLIVNFVTYIAIGVFLWANRRLPWLWVVALGTASNTLAISLNGGVMPASLTARSQPSPASSADFVNSGVVAHPHLEFLGDVIPSPSWLPLHNLVSVGDLLIIGGALLVVANQTRRKVATARV